MWVRRVVAAVSLIDISALDLAPSEPLGVLDCGPQGVPVIRIAGQRLGVQHELAAGRAGVGGGDRDLDAELIGRAGFALADAFDIGGVEGIKLPATLTLLLRTDLAGARQWPLECLLQGRLAGNLAVNVTDDTAEPRAQDA